jgi:hypothetical protein
MLDLLIKRELTRTVGTLNNETVDEITATMDTLFGGPDAGSEWREVGVWDAMIRTVARSANRVFVGRELCMCCTAYRGRARAALISAVQAGTKSTS